ncbi:alpha/beta hydrolase [Psychromarinibacter sp. S121]|uniref:alpha/beta hydrolase n=1 Tax=Psychromarinibacter sp. S121 TaxID=3415127 RepID=UPI003C7ED7FF
MRRIAVLIIVLFVVGCAPRAQIVFTDVPEVADLPSRSLFVATTRAVEAGRFKGKRSEDPYYLRFDVTVPPKRRLGDVPFATDEIDAETQYLAKGRRVYDSAAAFRSDLSAALARVPGGSREAIIYVHGFNNTFDEGVLRLAQLAADFNIHAVPVHYSWPSAGKLFGYAYDRDSALFARDGLDRLITEVQLSGARTIVIVAHSMGSQLVMETLRQRDIARPGSVGRDVAGVVLMSPDIDVDVFRSQARRLQRLPHPFGIFVSKRDRALNLSARLTGQENRLGTADANAVSDLEVTLIDVTSFSEGSGHFTAATSPLLISLFSRVADFEQAFSGDSSGRTGLLPGTILTVRNATEIILSPVTELVE